MQIKLTDQWHALCRDASRQRVVIILLSILSALFYLVTALSFSPDTQVTAVQDSRYEIPFGFRAVAMQSAGPLPEIQVGDYVDVIIDSAISLERVLVFDVIDLPNRQTTVVLAVPMTEVAMVANAASLGVVSLVLVG